MARTTTHLEPLDADEFAALGRDVRMQGGSRARQECSPRPVAYASPQPGQSHTCGCGRPRLLNIQYSLDSGHTQTYQACADCDAVALHPRFLEN